MLVRGLWLAFFLHLFLSKKFRLYESTPARMQIMPHSQAKVFGYRLAFQRVILQAVPLAE